MLISFFIGSYLFSSTWFFRKYFSTANFIEVICRTRMEEIDDWANENRCICHNNS